MRFAICHAVFVSTLAVVIVSATGDNDEGRILDVNFKAKAQIHRLDGQKTDGNDTEKRSKRDFSSSEQKSILDCFNYQRSLVGASDMNYLTWNSGIEFDLFMWTFQCNYDSDIYLSSAGGYGIKIASSKLSDGSDVQSLFADNEFYNALRSVHVRSVTASYSYCFTARAQGKTYKDVYLFAYALSTDSLFNENVQQYTPGPACTRCQGYVNWCYNNLCRGDCTESTAGCCSITNNIPARCDSSYLNCMVSGGSSNIEAKRIITAVGIAFAFYAYFQ